MKLFLRRVLALSALHAFLCVGFTPTKSFTGAFGLLGRTHSEMTRTTWETLAKELFGITRFTTNMESVFKTVDMNQAAVDDDQTLAELHFDGESFPEGQDRLVILINEIVGALQANNAPQARGLVGSALHSVQDFYSHSNWIEMGNRDPHPDLGVEGRAITRLDQDVPTCVDCRFKLNSLTCNDCTNNIQTKSLTSGYYIGTIPKQTNREKKNIRKCSHGGIIDYHRPIDTGFLGLQVQTADGINKDTRDCSFSPHGPLLHDLAAATADKGSIAFLRILIKKLSNDQLKLLFGVDPSASFLNNNAKARRALDLHPGASTLASRGVRDSTYHIEAFGSTIRARVFDGQLHRRTAIEQRDIADESIPALYDTVIKTERGSYVFVYADTSADISAIDAHHAQALATYREITISFFLFGQGTSPIDAEVISLCQQTGGQVFLLGPSEISVADTIAKRLSVDNSVGILHAYDSRSRTYAFPVDSAISNVTISVSGPSTILLTRPDGSQVTNSSTDALMLVYSTGSFIVITTTTIGIWELTVLPTAGSTFSVAVGGVSFLDLDFDFVQVSGRPAHQGDHVQASFPLSNSSVAINARLYDTFMAASFSARRLTGELIQTFSLVQGTSTDGYGGFTPDTFYDDESSISNRSLGEVAFLVYVTGLDISGNMFQRAQNTVYSPSGVLIQPPSPNTIHPGSHRNLTFSVQNYQLVNDTFNVTILSGAGFVVPGVNQKVVREGVTQTLQVNSARAKDITVYLYIPLTATTETDIVSVYIQGTKNTNTTNFSLVNLWVVPGDPQDDAFTWDGFLFGNHSETYSVDDPDNADIMEYAYGVRVDEEELF